MNLKIIGSYFGLNTNNEITTTTSQGELFSTMKVIMKRNYNRYLSYIYNYDYLKLLHLDLVIISSDSSELFYGIVPVHTRAHFFFDVLCDWLNIPVIFITYPHEGYERFSTEKRRIVKKVEELNAAFKHFNITKNSNVLLVDADYLNPHKLITGKIVRYLLKKRNQNQ